LRLWSWRRQGKLVRNVAIIGAGDYGARLLDHLEGRSESESIRIVGVFDDRSSRIPYKELNGYPILGDADDLISMARVRSSVFRRTASARRQKL
jgi:FlaA1/EpsC-like NDP-sugar epimerase